MIRIRGTVVVIFWLGKRANRAPFSGNKSIPALIYSTTAAIDKKRSITGIWNLQTSGDHRQRFGIQLCPLPLHSRKLYQTTLDFQCWYVVRGYSLKRSADARTVPSKRMNC